MRGKISKVMPDVKSDVTVLGPRASLRSGSPPGHRLRRLAVALTFGLARGARSAWRVALPALEALVAGGGRRRR